jgi:hypothetical protein
MNTAGKEQHDEREAGIALEMGPSRPADPVVAAAAAGKLTREPSCEKQHQHLPSRQHNRGPPLDDEPVDAARQTDRLADDLLNGAREIAAYLGTNVRKVYLEAQTGRLPIGHLGRKLIASKRQLTRHTNKITRGSSAA